MNLLDCRVNIFGIIATFLGYYTANSRAKETAEKWFSDNCSTLENNINKIENQMQKAKNRLADLNQKMQSATDKINQLENHIEQSKNDIEKNEREYKEYLRQKYQAQIDNSTHHKPEPMTGKPETNEYLAKQEEKSDNQDHYSTWDDRAFSAYISNNFAQSSDYWLHAAETKDATTEQVAQALSNAGFSLAQLGELEKAQEIYQKVIDGYCKNTNPIIQKIVIRTTIHMGDSFIKSNKPDNAQITYQKAIDYTNENTSDWGTEMLTRAMNGKAFALLLGAKAQLAANPAALVQGTLNEAQTLLQQTLERKPNWGMALGNLAYVQWLLQQSTAAESSFHQALLSKEDGGKFLHRATLDDIAQHPIPADQGFRELVDRLWAEYQNQASGPATG